MVAGTDADMKIMDMIYAVLEIKDIALLNIQYMDTDTAILSIT